jgi:hypothetical protein
MDNAQHFLSGGGVGAKWPTVGYVVEGTVTGWRMAQTTHYDSGELLFWEGKSRVEASKAIDKSSPVMQLIMDIDGEPTGETWEGLGNKRVALPDDDGGRTLYIKAALQAAFKRGLKEAGAKLEEGAFVRVERVADGAQTDKKKQAPHQYKVTWTPAAKNAAPANDFVNSADEEAPF